ncbi:MAG: aryl-sulfate sulfotransferase [Flavobacteriales bacterium]|nr:aryl-sulfate sulfotransferase [Flavobacteriales bacterium]MBT5132059.1 aryl-sulfate sulfotransferase [Flavobacteriales bacterium]
MRVFLAFSILLFVASCNNKKIEPGEQVEWNLLVAEQIEVSLNPTGLTFLSAEVSFETSEECSVEIYVDGAEPVQYSLDEYASSHTVPIVGLYPGVNNQVTIRLRTKEDATSERDILIKTEDTPEYLPEITIDELQESMMEPGMHLQGLHLGYGAYFGSHPMIFDNSGKLRWHLDLSHKETILWPVQVFENGNFFFTDGAGVVEFNWLGHQVNYWETLGYRGHHDLIELPNENFLISVQKYGATIDVGGSEIETTDDHIIEVDRVTGAVVHEYDMRAIQDVDRYDLSNNAVDWFHMNAVWYDEVDDAILVSGRNQSVVKIDRESGDLIWIMAPHKGWGMAGRDGTGFETSDYLLTAVDASGNALDTSFQNGNAVNSDFDWPWGQHAPMRLPNGNIAMFDNGYNRAFGNAAPYSRGVEYKVNDGNKTIQQVWEWGSDRGTDFYSIIISDIDYLPETQNRLITSGFVNGGTGFIGKVVEVPEGSDLPVFEATLEFTNTFGTGEFGWGQIDILYRSERLEIKPTM